MVGQDRSKWSPNNIFISLKHAGLHITDSMDMSLSQPGGDSEGQGSLEGCSPWVLKELYIT